MTFPGWLVARPIAHRGLHDASAGIVENTVGAAEAAIAAGFAIECDVQGTADGEAVVFHDFELGRLTGETGLVRQRRAADLAGLAVGGTAERIPLLSALLQRIAGRVPLVIEIKSRFDGDLVLADRVAALASTYEGPVAVKSWDPAVLSRLRATAPGLPRGVVARSSFEDPHWHHLDAGLKLSLANLLHFADSRPDFLSWWVEDLPCAGPHLCRLLAGSPVIAWTVRTPLQRQLARDHADQMVFEGFSPQTQGLAESPAAA